MKGKVGLSLKKCSVRYLFGGGERDGSVERNSSCRWSDMERSVLKRLQMERGVEQTRSRI